MDPSWLSSLPPKPPTALDTSPVASSGSLTSPPTQHPQPFVARHGNQHVPPSLPILWLKGIPTGTTKQYLESIFAPYGFQRIDLKAPKHLGQDMYAFVHFADRSNAENARLALHGQNILPGGAPVVVGWRQEAPPASHAGRPEIQQRQAQYIPPRQTQPTAAPVYGHHMPQLPQAQHIQSVHGHYSGSYPSQGGYGSNAFQQSGAYTQWQQQPHSSAVPQYGAAPNLYQPSMAHLHRTPGMQPASPSPNPVQQHDQPPGFGPYPSPYRYQRPDLGYTQSPSSSANPRPVGGTQGAGSRWNHQPGAGYATENVAPQHNPCSTAGPHWRNQPARTPNKRPGSGPANVHPSTPAPGDKQSNTHGQGQETKKDRSNKKQKARKARENAAKPVTAVQTVPGAAASSPTKPVSGGKPALGSESCDTSPSGSNDVTNSVQHNKPSPAANSHHPSHELITDPPTQNPTSPPPNAASSPPLRLAQNATHADSDPIPMEGISPSGAGQENSQQSVAASEPELNLTKKKARKRARQQAASSAANQGSRDQSVDSGPNIPDNSNNNTPSVEQPIAGPGLNENADSSRATNNDTASAQPTGNLGGQSQSVDTSHAPSNTGPDIPNHCDCPEGYDHFCQLGPYSGDDLTNQLAAEAAAVSTRPLLSTGPSRPPKTFLAASETKTMSHPVTTLAIRYGTKVSKIRVDSSKLFPMEKWYGSVVKDLNVFGKSNGHTDGQHMYNLTLDLTGSIPPLPVSFDDDEVIAAVKFLLRVMHTDTKKGDVGLGIKHILLVHHMNSVLGLNPPYRNWMEKSVDPYARDLFHRIECGIPISAPDWETTLLACQTIQYREGYVYVAAALIRSSTLTHTSTGKPVLQPTGDGLVEGKICGELAVDALVRIRDTLPQHVISTADAGVAKYRKSRVSSAACRLCIGARTGALMGAVADLGVWPGKKPDDLKGVSLWGLQSRMGEMGDGIACSERVAKYGGTCCGPAHATESDNLFSIQDVAYDIWSEVQEMTQGEVWNHGFMQELFESEGKSEG